MDQTILQACIVYYCIELTLTQQELITVCSHVNVFLSNLAYGLIGQLLTEAFFPTMTYEDYIEKNILQLLMLMLLG